MCVYSVRPFYSNIANFGMVDVHLSKHPDVNEVAITPVEIAYIEEEHYSYSPTAHANISDRAVNTMHYRHTLDQMKRMAEHESITEKDEEL